MKAGVLRVGCCECGGEMKFCHVGRYWRGERVGDMEDTSANFKETLTVWRRYLSAGQGHREQGSDTWPKPWLPCQPGIQWSVSQRAHTPAAPGISTRAVGWVPPPSIQHLLPPFLTLPPLLRDTYFPYILRRVASTPAHLWTPHLHHRCSTGSAHLPPQ